MGYITNSRSGCELVIKEKKSLVKLLNDISPYVKIKKTQLNVALEILDSLPLSSKKRLIKIAKLADSIGKANIKSKSRRKHSTKTLLHHFNDPATTDPTVISR